MKRKLIYIILLVISPTSILTLFAQETFFLQDTLNHLSVKELIVKITNNRDNTARLVYSEEILNRGKQLKDTANIIEGFDLMAFFNDGQERLRLLDSVIVYTEIQRDSIKTTQALLEKGNEYYKLRYFKNAFDYYIKAYENAKNLNNENLLYSIQNGISVLRLQIGQNKEALDIQKKNLVLLKEKKESFRAVHRLVSYFSLATSYRKLGILDSASYHNKQGINLALRETNDEMYNLFVLNEGIVLFEKDNLVKAYDSISKSLPYFEKNKLSADLGFAYFYIGKIFIKQKKDSLGIEYLKKVDSIFQKTNDINPELEQTYRIIVGYYRKNADLESQLDYLNRLIVVDSTLNSYKSYLVHGISQKYDIPELVKEKNGLIEKLNSQKLNLNLVVFGILLVTVGIYFFFHYRNRKLKDRVNELLNSSPQAITTSIPPINKVVDREGLKKIPEQVRIGISKGLSEFEQKLEFINPNITLIELARMLNTNTNYLSHFINNEKGINFNNYVNELRINYGMEKLKNSEIFRSYKISAIARECGFNNAETFSKLFKKTYGVYPSFFIRELNKKMEKTTK